MRHPRPSHAITEVAPSHTERLRRRRRWYLALMGTCLGLLALAWTVVVQYSPTLAAVMTCFAAPIPPIAAIIANWGEDR